MASFLDTLETWLSVAKSNPAIQKYAEPILFAIFTGASEIDLPEGKIKIFQQGTATKFTIGKAVIAIEEFIFSNETSIQIGTTRIDYVSNATNPILSAPVSATPTPST